MRPGWLLELLLGGGPTLLVSAVDSSFVALNYCCHSSHRRLREGLRPELDAIINGTEPPPRSFPAAELTPEEVSDEISEDDDSEEKEVEKEVNNDDDDIIIVDDSSSSSSSEDSDDEESDGESSESEHSDSSE